MAPENDFRTSKRNLQATRGLTKGLGSVALFALTYNILRLIMLKG